MTELRRAIALDPDLVEARVALAQALARTGQREDAHEQEAAVRRINATKASVGRAMLLMEAAEDSLERGDTAAALPLLREAVELAPTLTEAQFQLALGLKRSDEELQRSRSGAGQPRSGADAAETALVRVLQLDPAHARAYAELGLLHAKRGSPGPAGAALRRAVSLAPGLVAAQRALVELASAQDDWPTAISALEALMAWQPEDASAPLGLVQALLRQHDCVGAKAVFERASGLQPNLAATHRDVAGALKACAPGREGPVQP
jgi:tetratricopeptide (TPR) repeat protein